MKTLVCCIGRLENQYIREFVEHYKKLGFDNICLYDNNRDGEENFYDVIGDYIDSGFVILKNYRNKTICQLSAYQECYNTYSKEYDWIAFFDCDEFLELGDFSSISEYLSQHKFDRYKMIHINWVIFGDNGYVRNDGRGCYDRFHNVGIKKTNRHIKSIIRSGIENFVWIGNPHTPIIDCRCCDSKGNDTESSSPYCENNVNGDSVYICHFSTKTIEEYCDKLIRGYPDGIFDKNMIEPSLENLFFKYSEMTKEKLDVIYHKLGIKLKNINRNNEK